MFDQIRQLGNSLRSLILKGLIKTIDDSQKLQLLKVYLSASNEQEEIERIQEYGLTSNPPTESEAIVVQCAGAADNLVCLKVDSAEYRIKDLGSGEVAIYSQHGQKVVLNNSGQFVFNEGNLGIARINHETVSDMTVDENFFTFIAFVATSLSSLGYAYVNPPYTVPINLTTKISQGSSKVLIDD